MTSKPKRGQEKDVAVGSGIFIFVALVASYGALVMYLSPSNYPAALDRLLGGLLKTIRGGAAASAALSSGPPDLEKDWPVFRIFVIFFFVLNWGVRLLIVEPIVRFFKLTRGQHFNKFAQSVMEAIFYASFTLVGLRVVPSQEWVWPSYLWWQGFAEGGHEIMRSDLQCYYLMYIARYSQAILSVLLEPKRKDFIEMLVHHLVTVCVIYISYVYGWNRVGVVVMVLLDPGDVPLHLAKLCKYIADANGTWIWQFAADRLFELFAVVFFISRLVCYGYVCWSAHLESAKSFSHGLPEWTCIGLLYTLFVLQLYWFSLIIKIGLRMMKGESVEDIRSDDEDEDADPKKEGKKQS